MLNSVAGTPTARGGRLARAARMWWTPEQGGLHPAYGSTLFTQTEPPQQVEELEVPSDAELCTMQDRGELPSDDELAKKHP